MGRNEYECQGILTYDDNGQYQIENRSNNTNFNLSVLLNAVYYSRFNNYLKLRIEKDGCVILFNEEGNIYRRKEIETGIKGYCINGNELENKLFNNTYENVKITAEHKLPNGIGEEYGKLYRIQT